VPIVQSRPMVMRSDLNAPSSSECDWSRAAMLSVAPSPTLTRLRSEMAQPSSKTRRPIRAPSSRQNRGLNGVPSNMCMKVTDDTFQYRSCRQNGSW
jgi:hypothetical protein